MAEHHQHRGAATGTSEPERAPLTAEQAAEFRGLFFGEGHIDLMKSGRSRTLTPRVRIAVRDDDEAVVAWCLRLFGGGLTRDQRTRSVCWHAVGKERLQMIVEALSGGSLPSKKRAEVDLLREAVALKGVRGVHATAETRARLEQIREDLKALRRYRSTEVAA